jgi:proteasome component ECM29
MYFFFCFWRFHEQLGVLNVVDTMELGPEPVYPLYLVASADRYRCSFVFFSITRRQVWISFSI